MNGKDTVVVPYPLFQRRSDGGGVGRASSQAYGAVATIFCWRGGGGWQKVFVRSLKPCFPKLTKQAAWNMLKPVASMILLIIVICKQWRTLNSWHPEQILHFSPNAGHATLGKGLRGRGAPLANLSTDTIFKELSFPFSSHYGGGCGMESSWLQYPGPTSLFVRVFCIRKWGIF